MKLPLDAPVWLDRALARAEDDLKDQMAKARTSDESLRSTGAYWLWKRIEDEFTLEADKQEKELIRQNAALNARRDYPGTDA
jgi:hypothetical protein